MFLGLIRDIKLFPRRLKDKLGEYETVKQIP